MGTGQDLFHLFAGSAALFQSLPGMARVTNRPVHAVCVSPDGSRIGIPHGLYENHPIHEHLGGPGPPTRHGLRQTGVPSLPAPQLRRQGWMLDGAKAEPWQEYAYRAADEPPQRPGAHANATAHVYSVRARKESRSYRSQRFMGRSPCNSEATRKKGFGMPIASSWEPPRSRPR